MYTARGLKTGKVYMFSTRRSTLMLKLSRKHKFKSQTGRKSPKGYKEAHVYPEPLVIRQEDEFTE